MTLDKIAGVGGPALDSLAEEAKNWYINMREFLIEALTSGGYPFGAVKLTPLQQLEKYNSMTPQDWQNMYSSLMALHRGKPDAPFLVEKSLASYVRMMHNLGQIYSGRIAMPPPNPTDSIPGA